MSLDGVWACVRMQPCNQPVGSMDLGMLVVYKRMRLLLPIQDVRMFLGTYPIFTPATKAGTAEIVSNTNCHC